MKRALLIIAGIVGLVVVILAGLYQAAPLPNKVKNGFTRNWKPGTIHLIRQSTLTVPLEKICGATASHYFFTVPNPTGVIVLDSTLLQQDTMVYDLPANPDIFISSTVWVDSPEVYFFANNIPALFRGKLNYPLRDSVSLGHNPVTRTVLISPDHIVIRALTKTAKEQVFQKVNSRTGQVMAEAAIIPDQQAGGFDDDGTLLFDRATQRLLYVQYYSNRIYCLDTNLNVLYTSKTIDTTNINPTLIKRIEYKDGEKITPGKSRITVNENACTGNGYLFVVSGLRADNETRSEFTRNGVVDMYKIEDGEYAGSFHVPLMEKEKISSIWVQNNTMLVLYKDHLAQYRLRL